MPAHSFIYIEGSAYVATLHPFSQRSGTYPAEWKDEQGATLVALAGKRIFSPSVISGMLSGGYVTYKNGMAVFLKEETNWDGMGKKSADRFTKYQRAKTGHFSVYEYKAGSWDKVVKLAKAAGSSKMTLTEEEKVFLRFMIGHALELSGMSFEEFKAEVRIAEKGDANRFVELVCGAFTLYFPRISILKKLETSILHADKITDIDGRVDVKKGSLEVDVNSDGFKGIVARVAQTLGYDIQEATMLLFCGDVTTNSKSELTALRRAIWRAAVDDGYGGSYDHFKLSISRQLMKQSDPERQALVDASPKEIAITRKENDAMVDYYKDVIEEKGGFVMDDLVDALDASGATSNGTPIFRSRHEIGNLRFFEAEQHAKKLAKAGLDASFVFAPSTLLRIGWKQIKKDVKEGKRGRSNDEDDEEKRKKQKKATAQRKV